MLSFDVSPVFEIRIQPSPYVTMPRSRLLAADACKKSDGVPVDAEVVEILRLMWPDLPIPATITRPSSSRISCAAAAKSAGIPLAICEIASASMFRTHFPI